MLASLVLKLLLSPISLLYGIGVSLRNMLYDAEITKPSRFSIPIISVGNLSIGGAGKTPHIEYLIKMLMPYINVAVLSRGYNRASKGFRFVSPQDTALLSGDEPLMYSRKYQNLPVAVCENRSIAIPQMMHRYADIETILLDDAFQHRSVLPYINILLTQYEKPFTTDYLLPSGRLREWRSSYKRADAIIVTKCPDDLSIEKAKELENEIGLLENQKIFFTRYEYKHLYHFYQPAYTMALSDQDDVILISAIANSNYLLQYIKKQVLSCDNIAFADHHNFSEEDIDHLIKLFRARESNRKYIVTTEKDAVRLHAYSQKLYEAQIPVYVLPIEVKYLFEDEHRFNLYIKDTLIKFEA